MIFHHTEDGDKNYAVENDKSLETIPQAAPAKDNEEFINPLSYLEADEWARMFLSDAAYQKFFGEIPEDSKKINVSIRLRGDTYQKLQRLSAACAMPASECIEQMLNGSYDALRGKKDEETNLYSGD